MRRSVLVAGLAIALLCLASATFMAWRVAPSPLSAPATAMVHASPGHAPAAAAAAPTEAAAPAALPVASTAPAQVAAPAPRTLPPPAPPAPPASRAATLRPPSRALSKLLRRELAAGSGDVRASLARCAAGEIRPRQPAVLLLKIETLDGEVRIVDAPVQTKGDASDAFVACAQRTLRNRIIPAPVARPGSLNRMPLALTSWETR